MDFRLVLEPDIGNVVCYEARKVPYLRRTWSEKVSTNLLIFRLVLEPAIDNVFCYEARKVSHLCCTWPSQARPKEAFLDY